MLVNMSFGVISETAFPYYLSIPCAIYLVS
jgi:hypothetical protein